MRVRINYEASGLAENEAESLSLPRALLSSDIALIAIMPLSARLVLFPAFSVSAEVL